MEAFKVRSGRFAHEEDLGRLSGVCAQRENRGDQNQRSHTDREVILIANTTELAKNTSTTWRKPPPNWLTIADL
jgi:hypothetical protein